MTFDEWREAYSPHGMMNEAMARAAWKAAYDECEQKYKPALDIWFEKTDWMQAQAGELGMHKADALKKRIDDLTAEVERLKQHACKGIPRTGCNYLADCDRVCNKCGKVHNHDQMVAGFYDKQKPNIPQIADAYGKALGYPDRNKS